MTRCPAHVPMDTPRLKGSITPAYGCEGIRGHDGAHFGPEIGMSWRESDEAGLTLMWDDGDVQAVAAKYYTPRRFRTA